MPVGVALCVGLNRVNPASYAGWDGQLAGCVNDAHAMQAVLTSQRFSGFKMLLDQEASAEAVLGSIDDASRTLSPGDLFVVTYSGHGSTMADPWGIYPAVDTWCAYDRQIIGHELALLWSGFRPGVRVLVLSDSCHSGTVTRSQSSLVGELTRTWNPPGELAGQILTVLDGASPKQKNMPSEVQAAVEAQHRYLYKVIWRGITPPQPSGPVLLLSACQSNQTASDGSGNGLFTEKVLQVWSNGAFDGGHPEFHRRVMSLMPPWQTPNLFPQGPDDPAFLRSKPFTV